jgi:hypothetical protein
LPQPSPPTSAVHFVESTGEPSAWSNSSDHARTHPGGPLPPVPVVVLPETPAPPLPVVVVTLLDPPLAPAPLLVDVTAVDPEPPQAGSVTAAAVMAITPRKAALRVVEKKRGSLFMALRIEVSRAGRRLLDAHDGNPARLGAEAARSWRGAQRRCSPLAKMAFGAVNEGD